MAKFLMSMFALIATIHLSSGFIPLGSFEHSLSTAGQQKSRYFPKATNKIHETPSSSSKDSLGDAQKFTKPITITFAKMLLGSALFFSATTFQPQSSTASTAPAAQAIAALEASGKSIEELVPEEAPKVTKRSSARAVKVGERLKALNAKMYGAFWCSHCNNQKQALGVEVAKQFEYIECDKDGANSQYKVCRSTKITGYPTWEIKGELYPGEKDIAELESLLSSIESDVLTADRK